MTRREYWLLYREGNAAGPGARGWAVSTHATRAAANQARYIVAGNQAGAPLAIAPAMRDVKGGEKVFVTDLVSNSSRRSAR